MEDRFHTTLMLNDGREMGVDWLGPSDRGALDGFMDSLSFDDCRYLGLDCKNPKSIDQCLSAAESGRRRILGAIDPAEGGAVAGICYLGLGSESKAHMAWVEPILHPDYRGLGLGSGLLREIIEYTTGAGLVLLEVGASLDDAELINGAKRLGFEPKAIMEGYRVDCRGEPYDVILLIKRLQYISAKEFLYRF